MRKEADVNPRHAAAAGSPWNEGKMAESSINARECYQCGMCET